MEEKEKINELHQKIGAMCAKVHQAKHYAWLLYIKQHENIISLENADIMYQCFEAELKQSHKLTLEELL